MWVRRAKGEPDAPVAASAFLPVSVRPAKAAPVLPKPAITVSFRSGHQLMLHEATPAMLAQLLAALS
ncbi:hypothetical protein M0H57_003272 [Proteus mirabilis]|uniref:hypothetical protein n=1 Tax=Proteus mirabilis TaxID=584 RepID=UPI0023F67C7E|nr:hypothetical protein [Proteus mirabilis]MDF7207362.1 hypothetical protein [Proteus mirabilis]